MRPRFHVPAFDATAPEVRLPADEATHLVRVLRLTRGSEVEVFDGLGGLWRVEVIEVHKLEVTVRPLEPIAPAAEARIAIELAPAVLKGDKMDGVVRDAVMLGAASIQPLVTARTEISAAALARSRRASRWQRIAVASVKQCGRAVVPPVHEAVPIEAYLVGVGACLMLVEPGAAGHVVGVRDVPAAESVRVMVGPEGGWTPEEVAAAERAGVRLVSLGARTLRADAVPLVALTALMITWSEL